jgi:hypothetical protein
MSLLRYIGRIPFLGNFWCSLQNISLWNIFYHFPEPTKYPFIRMLIGVSGSWASHSHIRHPASFRLSSFSRLAFPFLLFVPWWSCASKLLASLPLPYSWESLTARPDRATHEVATTGHSSDLVLNRLAIV